MEYHTHILCAATLCIIEWC